ncbi:MAG: pyridoxine 5'-phosphate synthase [Candidatus Riflebacteria bacterium]|nr:pyridoxine 5'-phosphate synthase [Candidatus Riflebacteria bacterium]
MIKLGVNIDHVATLRQARKGREPDPVHAAAIAELAGADGITVHLREDRRHIQDRDLLILRESVRTRLNLEMAIEEGVSRIAEEIKPDMATLVPEKREEVTTEGGLDVISNKERIKEVIGRLKKRGILVSLFIDPERKQVEKSANLKADFIEFHTGCFANAVAAQHEEELTRLHEMAELAVKLGLRVNAGHGLNYWNVAELVTMAGLEEFNIGHSIISRAVLVGLDKSVKEMKAAIREGEILLIQRNKLYEK